MKYTITQNALHFSNQVTTQSSKHLFYKFKFILGLALVFFFQNLSAQEIPFVDLKGENPSHNIRFVRNVGQLNNTDYETVNQITHHSVRATPRTFFQEDLISLVFEKLNIEDSEDDSLWKIDFTWSGENRFQSAPVFQDFTNEKIHYYLNTCASGCDNLALYTGIKYPSIYENINLIVSSNDEFYKFYFENLPESNPESIELEFLGQDSIIVTDELLIVYMDNVGLTLKAPIVYQINSNEVTTRLNWKPKFSLNSSGNIHLDIDNGIYDHNQSLIYMFDENLKAAGTYETKNLVKGRLEGGSKWDSYYDIDIYTPIDGTERPTVCGTTTSINFPTTYKYTVTKGGGNEVLVVCYDNTLNRRWSVVYGESGDDGYLTPYGISVDNDGNSYIVPEVRSNDIPLIDIAGSADYHDNATSGSEILIARFDKDGFHTWATFFGVSGSADAGDIILNKSTNEFFVCGMEGGFPVQAPGNNAFPYSY